MIRRKDYLRMKELMSELLEEATYYRLNSIRRAIMKALSKLEKTYFKQTQKLMRNAITITEYRKRRFNEQR